MHYITLDLEWNQAYAEQLQAVQKRLSARLRGEVIQIGAVKLDEKMRPCGSYSVIVKPRYFQRINRHVRDLTGITQGMIDGGITLENASERFHRWCGEDFAFLTWGPDDIPMLEDNFRVHGLDVSWLSRVYDLQPIFNAQTDGVNKQRSLEYAMEHFGIAANLPAHDALNDAYFTALVAAKLDMKRGIREYRENHGSYLAEEEIGNADTGGRGFAEIAELLKSPEASAPRCPLCDRALSQQEKTLHSKGQRYTLLLTCREHGDMLMQLKLQRNFNDTWRARKTVAQADEESVRVFREKLKESERQKKAHTRRRRRGAKKPAGQTPVAVGEQTD